MKYKETPVILLLFVLNFVGFQCNSNPNGTPQLSNRQLNSAAYDRFFQQFERFEVNRYGDQVLRRMGAIYFTQQSPQGVKYTGAKPAAGAYMAVKGHPEMALAIYYDADLNNAPPPMQVQLLARRNLNEGGFVGELSDPIIFCRAYP